MLSLGVLEWIGAIGGGAGALLLAFNNRWSGYGFVLFLASNAAWMSYGLMTHTFGMVTMQIVCTGTSLLGIWRWLVKPRLGRSRRYRDDLNMLPVQQLKIDRSFVVGIGNNPEDEAIIRSVMALARIIIRARMNSTIRSATPRCRFFTGRPPG